MIIVFISELLIVWLSLRPPIFNSRAKTRCADYTRVVESFARKKTSVCKTLVVWSGAFILALDTTKATGGVTSSHVLTAYRWQTIDLND